MRTRGWLLAVVAAVALLPRLADGRINVVSLPGRDSVQLTIYNSVDLTLVRETRTLTLRKGLNRLEFSWANTLIDPTSVMFRAVTHGDEVDVLDVSFPPRVANTLEWRIQSEYSGEVEVEIRYFTSGISWAADYLAEAGEAEKMLSLSGSVRLNNQSGEDYENAQARLVVGVVRLVENIVELARARSEERLGRKASTTLGLRLERQLGEDAYALMDQADKDFGGGMGGRGGGAVMEKRKEIKKEGLSEYFIYTVEGRETVLNGWARRLLSFKADGVPITSYYKFEREQWGEAVQRYYRFTNSEPSKLGKEPLPDGSVQAYRLLSRDQLYSFVGRTRVKYIPVNETVDLELGRDREVLVKPAMMNWEKVDIRFDAHGDVKGWTTRETWGVEVQNSKNLDVVLDIRRSFGGDWAMITQAVYEKVDANKVKFVIPLKSREKRTFTYQLTTRHGINATR